MFKNKKTTKNQKILIISLVLFVLLVSVFLCLNVAKKTALRNEVTSKLELQHQISKNLAGITETYSYNAYTSGVPMHTVYEDENYLGIPTGVKSDFLIIPDGAQLLQDLGYSKSVLGNNYRTMNEGKDVIFSSNAWDYVTNKESGEYTGYRLRDSGLFIPFEGLDSRTTWEKTAPEFLGGKTAREKLDELQASNSPEKVQSLKKELTPGSIGDGNGNVILGTPGVPGSASGDTNGITEVVGPDKQTHKLDENGNPVVLNPNTNKWEPDTTPDATISPSNQKDSNNQNPNPGNMQASSDLSDQQVASDAYPANGFPTPGPDNSLLSTAKKQEAEQRYQEALDKYNKGELSADDFSLEKALYRGSFIEPKTDELKQLEKNTLDSANAVYNNFANLYPERAKEILAEEEAKKTYSKDGNSGNNPPSDNSSPSLGKSVGESWINPPAPKDMATLDDATNRLLGSDGITKEAVKNALELSKNYDSLDDKQKALVDSVNDFISYGKKTTEKELEQPQLNVLEPSLTGNKVREEMNAWNKLDEERTKAGFPDTTSITPSNDFDKEGGTLEPFNGEAKWNVDPSKLNPPSPSAMEAYQTLNDFSQNGTDPRSWSEYLNPLGPSLQEKLNDLQKTASLTPEVKQFGGIDLTKGDVSEPVKKLDDYFNNMQDPRSLSERLNPFGPTIDEKINSLENQIYEDESKKKQILNGAEFNYQDALYKYANGEISEEEKNKALEKFQEETDKYLKETAVISQTTSPETLPQSNFDFNSDNSNSSPADKGSDRSEGQNVQTTGDRTGSGTTTSNFWDRNENQYSGENNSAGANEVKNDNSSQTQTVSTEPYNFKDNFSAGNGSQEEPFAGWTNKNIAEAFSYDEKTGELKLNEDWKEQTGLPGGEYLIIPPSKAEIIKGLFEENKIDSRTKDALDKKNEAGTLKKEMPENQDVYDLKKQETTEGKPNSDKYREMKAEEILKTSQ